MTDNTVRRPEDAAAEPEAQGAEAADSRAEQVKVAELVETLARENAEPQGPAAANAGGDGEPAQAHRA